MTFELIGPAEAQALLDRPLMERRMMREDAVQQMAQAMKDGTFTPPRHPVVIEGGKLKNGFHRLKAVVLSEVPCRFRVERR